jgi:hypothetical protein
MIWVPAWQGGRQAWHQSEGLFLEQTGLAKGMRIFMYLPVF